MQQAVGRLGSFISQSVYTVTGPLHPFGGAVDIVVVEQPDGTFKSSPWYVRFGKFQGVLKARERLVHITVNGVDSNFHMYLDHKGEAFFLREIDAHEGEAESDVIYPSSSGDDTDHDNDKRSLKSKSCNLDSQNGKIVVARTSSRRSRILGLVFGRRSLKGQIEENADVNKVDSLERAEIAANLLELKWSTNLTGDGDQPPLKHTEQILGSSSGTDKMDNGLHQGDSNEDTCSNSDFELGQDLSTRIDGKEVIYDVTGSDLQVACIEVVEARMEKQLEGEEVSGVSTVSTAGNNISEVDISADGIQSLVYCETSESSKVGMDCSTEQVHVHHEVLHGTTVLLPEGTETEEVTKNVDLGMPVMEVSEFHSGDRQTNCSDSDVGMNDVADVEDLPTSPKSQIVNMDLGHGSTEKVESNYVTKPSCYRRLDDQTLDENNMKDKDVSSTLSSPLGSLGDFLPRKTTRTSLSASSEEENFLFSDLDESRINDQFEGSTSPEYVDKEDHLSYENGTEKVDHLVYANYDLRSPLENSTTENQTSDLEKLRVISSPIVIPRNEAAGEEVGHHTGSLPNISTYSDSLGQHDVCYPLSQSLDSESTSLQWTFPGKDDLKYLNSDEDKENQLSHEELGAKDYHSSGEFNNTVLNLPVGPETVRHNRLFFKIGHHYFPWDAAAPIVIGMLSFGSQQIFKLKGMIPVDQVEKNHTGDPSTLNPSPGGNWRIWPFSLRRSGSRNAILPTPTDAKDTTLGNSLENTISTDANKNELKPYLMKKKVRENTPTSEQVASLNLKEGRNIVTFTFSTAMLGKQQVDARIYLWKWNTHIVISDVDGTITKSDVLGQFMPLVGIDWSQTGVAHLFSAIKENGYQLLFLSARSISQAYLTRQFLVNLKQDGKVLPDGPVVISPDGLFPSLYREVIRRVPHEFKIACLEGIRTLFPSDCNPFYAGFGNRDTDEISYLKVGIPKGKIFIINPKGEVAVNRRLDTKSYTSLHALVNGMFPPMNSSEQEDYNSWNYWKLPPPVIDI